MPDRVIMVRGSELEALREALDYYACRDHYTYENGPHYSSSPVIMDDKGHVARAALAKSEAAATQPVAYAYVVAGECEQIEWGTDVDLPDDPALVWLYPHPTPDGCGREGKHQWGGPERNREVCVNCGATRVLEVPDTKGPYEARFVDGGIPSDCCEYGVISLSEGREVCRVWREQDARAIASALSAFTAGGDDG